MNPDPLTVLEGMEARRRALKPGEHPDPAAIEPFMAVLARAIVSPEGVACPRMDYRCYTVRAVLLRRLTRVYGVGTHGTVLDLTRAVDLAQEERLGLDRAEEIESLERRWAMTDREPAAEPGEGDEPRAEQRP